MNNLATLAALSDLQLLRDLADLAARREDLLAIEQRAQALRCQLAAETKATADHLDHDQTTARAFATYAIHAGQRLATLDEQRLSAAAAETVSRQNALRAQGRARAVAILQDRARHDWQAAVARREESLAAACGPTSRRS